MRSNYQIRAPEPLKLTSIFSPSSSLLWCARKRGDWLHWWGSFCWDTSQLLRKFIFSLLRSLCGRCVDCTSVHCWMQSENCQSNRSDRRAPFTFLCIVMLYCNVSFCLFLACGLDCSWKFYFVIYQFICSMGKFRAIVSTTFWIIFQRALKPATNLDKDYTVL